MKKQTNTNTGGPAFECVTSSTNPMTTQERLFEELPKASERNKDNDPQFWIPAFIQSFVESEKSLAVEEYREGVRERVEQLRKEYYDKRNWEATKALSDTLELL